MVHAHTITPAARAQVVGDLMGHAGEYGYVSTMSRRLAVSRQTLYAWEERGVRALEAAFTPPPAAPMVTPPLERAILTTLVEGHAGYRGIQACLRATRGLDVSLGTLVAVVQEAQRRALQQMARPLPAGLRAVALDEIYGHDRHGAYLSVVDAHSGAVWVTTGPVPVDAETWTLVLWTAQERGLRWQQTVSDGGQAMQQACTRVAPHTPHQRDVWHVVQECSKVQGRLDRHVRTLQEHSATVARQAARMAAGQRPRGRRPRSDSAAHQAQVTRAQQGAENLRYLSRELGRLLAVVVLGRDGVLDSAARQTEIDTLLALLAEVGDAAPAATQPHLRHLQQYLTQALPALLSFAVALDGVQQEGARGLGAAGLRLLAWAWQRRAILGPTTDDLLAALPADWRPAAQIVFHAWESAVRASSPVETWHSFLRPHLAVHRTLAPGLLALLAVYYNHHVATRGCHAGQSPLQRSGLPDAPPDWLDALGYPPASPATAVRTRRVDPVAPLSQAA
jgi:hypothetical protein